MIEDLKAIAFSIKSLNKTNNIQDLIDSVSIESQIKYYFDSIDYNINYKQFKNIILAMIKEN